MSPQPVWGNLGSSKQLGEKKIAGWGYGWAVEYLPSMLKALCSVMSTAPPPQREANNKQVGLWMEREVWWVTKFGQPDPLVRMHHGICVVLI